MNDTADNDPRLYAIPDIHGHAKGEHKAFTDERPIPLSARMLFLWFYHACRRGWPRFLMVSDHMNYLTFEDPAAINLVRRALKLAQAGDLYGAAETASVEVGHAAVVSEGLRRGMRYSIGAEVDNDPRSRPDAQNIVDAMKPDGMIRSVHFLTIDHPTHGPNWNWPFDNPEFADVHEIVGTAKTWELYMATLLDSIERLPGNILGHFYVPAIFGHWPADAVLDAYENQIIDACEARGMAIEFNTRFLYRDHSDDEKLRYLTAHRRLLAKCKAKNVGVAIGSDAHSPKDQGRAFETVLALLDECEINELVFPISGRLARVALRVERKVEPVPEPPPAEERKAVRRTRPSDAPVIEENEAQDVTPPPAVEEFAPTVKAKPRPRRSKAKSAEPSAEAPIEVVALETDPLSTEPLADIVTAPTADPIVVAPEAELVEVEARTASVESSAPVATASVEAEAVVARALIAQPVESASEGASSDDVAPVDVVSSDGAQSDAAPNDTDATADPVTNVESTGAEAADTTAQAITSDRKGRSSTNGVRAKAAPTNLKSPATSAKPAAKRTAKPTTKSAKKAAPAAKKTTAVSAAKKIGAIKKAAPKKAAAKKAPAKKAAARTTAVKKSAAKKTVAKKARVKKTPRRR